MNARRHSMFLAMLLSVVVGVTVMGCEKVQSVTVEISRAQACGIILEDLKIAETFTIGSTATCQLVITDYYARGSGLRHGLSGAKINTGFNGLRDGMTVELDINRISRSLQDFVAVQANIAGIRDFYIVNMADGDNSPIVMTFNVPIVDKKTPEQKDKAAEQKTN